MPRSNKISSRTPLIIILLAACLPFLISAAPPVITPGTEGKSLPAPDLNDPAFTIAIIPDRTAGKPWGLKYLKTAVTELNIIRPDAVFTTGDMVQGYTRSPSLYGKEAEEYLSVVNNLRSPFYPLPGNHDVISGYRDPQDQQFIKLYQNYFGPLYYSTEFPQAVVISLFTDEQLDSSPRFSETQINWVKRQINRAASENKPIIVLMHKPAWRFRNSNWDEIHNQLKKVTQQNKTPVTVVAGHFHSLQKDPDRDGVQYYLIGTCGALIDQHPLGGQFQQITYIRILDDGKNTVVYHVPIGTTLPGDFVLAADQSRDHILKTYRDTCIIKTTLDQPVDHPVRGDIDIAFHNPIDRPITITGHLVKSPPKPTIVKGYGFVSRTQIDIFNPFVTDINTPFNQLQPVEPFTLNPDEYKTIKVTLQSEAQGKMIPAPEIWFTAVFTDDQNRQVPVYIRRRIPLKMRFVVTDSLALNMPISAWVASVYDLRKPNPLLGLSARDGNLNIALIAFDKNTSYKKTDDPTERINNPESDAIIISLGRDDNQKQYLVEPFSPQHSVQQIIINKNSDPADRNNRASEYTLQPESKITYEVEKRDTGYGLIIHLPLNLAGKPGEEIPFNVRVADNDNNYHTQWRAWAPDDTQSTIILPTHY